jgi:hypothetical protein
MPAGSLLPAVSIQLRPLTNMELLKEPGWVLKEFADVIPGADTAMILFPKRFLIFGAGTFNIQ